MKTSTRIGKTTHRSGSPARYRAGRLQPVGHRFELGDRAFAAPMAPVDACHTLSPARIGGVFDLSPGNLYEQAGAGFAGGGRTALRKGGREGRAPGTGGVDAGRRVERCAHAGRAAVPVRPASTCRYARRSGSITAQVKSRGPVCTLNLASRASSASMCTKRCPHRTTHHPSQTLSVTRGLLGRTGHAPSGPEVPGGPRPGLPPIRESPPRCGRRPPPPRRGT